MGQDLQVKVTTIRLGGGREVDVARIGPSMGRPVLYFHSPATAGEEMGAAAEVANELGIHLVALVRPSVTYEEARGAFIAQVAFDTCLLVDRLDLKSPAVLGWSGGAPYALAASERLGSSVVSVHLVSPVPGPLTGPDAVPNQSDRLRQIAETSSTSSWATRPETLRDYRAVAAPWPFDVQSVRQPVTIWAPIDDEIVPPTLIAHLARRLGTVETIEVPGSHDWLTENWSAVLHQVST